MEMEVEESDIATWLESNRPGAHLELYVAVRKNAKPATFAMGSKARQQLRVLCLLLSREQLFSGADGELLVLKPGGGNAWAEDQKRTILLTDLSSMTIVSADEAAAGQRRWRDGADEFSHGLVIASKHRRDEWLCRNVSERMHIARAVRSLHSSVTGTALHVDGLDPSHSASHQASREASLAQQRSYGEARWSVAAAGERLPVGTAEREGNDAVEERPSPSGNEVGGGELGAAEEEEMLKMLAGDLRLEDMPTYKKQMSQDLSLLQDATIQSVLASGELFAALEEQLAAAERDAARLQQHSTSADAILKGVRADLVSLRASSLRFQTVWDNQGALVQALDRISADKVHLPAHHLHTLEHGAMLVGGKVPQEMRAAMSAWRGAQQSALDGGLPLALQGLEAVKALHRARHKREFAVSRRVLAACRRALVDAVAALSLHAKSPAPKPALPLVRVHSEVGEGEELIEAVAVFDPSTTEVQQTVYLQEMAGVMPQALAQLLGEEQRGMMAVAREGRLLYLPDIDSGEARGFLHGTAGAAGSAADAREALGGVLRRVGEALVCEERFVAGWLGVRRGGVGNKATVERERVAEMVLMRAFGDRPPVAQVMAMMDAILKQDPLAVAAMLAHLDAAAAAARDPPGADATGVEEGRGVGGGFGSGGALWRRVVSEVRVAVRARLVRYCQAQLQALTDAVASHSSGKKVPAWVGKLPTLVLAIIDSYATPRLQGSGEGWGGERGRGLETDTETVEMGVHDGAGLVENVCRELCDAAVQALATLARSDAKVNCGVWVWGGGMCLCICQRERRGREGDRCESVCQYATSPDPHVHACSTAIGLWSDLVTACSRAFRPRLALSGSFGQAFSMPVSGDPELGRSRPRVTSWSLCRGSIARPTCQVC